ncbi:peptide chain release factor 2 [bacterium]|nr:peptide chain release factor 2 [bacterium]
MFELAKKEKKIKKLEIETQKADFWKDKERAIKISQELSQLKDEIREFSDLKERLLILEELGKTASEQDFQEVEKRINEKELEVFLSGEHDRKGAILSIYAGAGGRDAQDWVTLLLRMYERYCQKKGFKTKILHQSFGEGGGPEGRIGTKSVTLEIKGPFAFGFLKGENGVHRLVRISPFSPQKLRHTSFARVEVIPKISEKDLREVKIDPKDLKIETFRASGPGGQYVNKRESAVRIRHLPTGIIVTCQSERLQGQNRKKAMDILKTKILQIKKEEKEREVEKIKGEKVSADWGNQIRNYVFHPYQLVKDLRTGVETTEVEDVLDGDLDQFIEAEIRNNK